MAKRPVKRTAKRTAKAAARKPAKPAKRAVKATKAKTTAKAKKPASRAKPKGTITKGTITKGSTAKATTAKGSTAKATTAKATITNGSTAKATTAKARPSSRAGATAEHDRTARAKVDDADLEPLATAEHVRTARAKVDEADLERLATAPLDTLTTRRLTAEDVAKARAADEPANENLPPPTRPSTPLATIAPRGVFLPDRVVVDVEGDTFPSTKLDEHGRDEAILPATTLDEIKERAAAGQRLVEGDPGAAFRVFRDALDLLPEPPQNWNAGGWLLVAMGECAIRSGDFAAAIAPLKDAMHCPGTIGNPWVHLRLGQCRLELGDERAADDLARAYMGGGRSLFDGLDPKYFALVESVLQPPPGHDRLP